jgi:TfoX/Sxy family transcriptional regulator of competence genes
MAYDEYLADRISQILREKQTLFVEKEMMGGVCFMVDGKMCVCISKDNLMARVGPEVYEEALKKEGCREMDFTGKPMKGFVYVDPDAIDIDEDLEYWVQLCLNYNPKAKRTKKKKYSN